jgi:DNA-binding response OmpR family regulator
MKILIAEDDTSIAEAYKDALETRNHKIILTENGEECLKKYQTEALTMQQSGYLAEQQNRKNSGVMIVIKVMPRFLLMLLF